MKKVLLLILLFFTTCQVSFAGPFETCPSKAYLFQSTPVQVYSVNLVTGLSSLIQSDTGINANINGVGFNFQDRYIYGYDTTNKRIVRLDQDFQAKVINTSGLPTDHTFYVGDVYDHYYYLYRTGKGLFKIDLSPLDNDPNAVLPVIQISSTATPKLTDFAFHPGDGSLYGVDNNSGWLYQFDTTTGASTAIGDTGELGTFGAGYFDVNGYYYLSRNQDGQIYRIDLSDETKIANGDVPAIKFADGPYSNQNDGARCANAPVIDEDSTIDFGDAPDSYTTLLSSNGPRHQMDNLTWLGSAPDGEQDGLLSPMSDNKAGHADEDGVGFVTAFEPGLNSLINVQASTTGYLSAWFDWNKDGDFDDANEKVFSDQLLVPGSNPLSLVVPSNATMGASWSRFRFSQQQGLNYYGGSTSGEIEDHPITITENGMAIRYFPSANDYATLAYEDNWPHVADYDMNDVIFHFRMSETVQDGSVVHVQITADLMAYGADYKNGFAIRLAGLLRSDIDSSVTTLSYNDIPQASNGLESDSNEAVFIISNNLSSHAQTDCDYFRTQNSCTNPLAFSFTLNIYFTEGANTSSLQAMPYDPFIFATPGYYHGEDIGFQPGRAWEVHLADQAPTEKFDQNLFGVSADASNPTQNDYFKTSTNLPWALLIPTAWQWPTERSDLVKAYPDFASYAESAGQQKQSWHQNPNIEKCYNTGE